MLGIMVVLLGVMLIDYAKNNRQFSARLHRVVPSAYQETMTFSAPVQHDEDGYTMQGAVRKIENITAGAAVEVSCGKQTYSGYLERLEPAFDGIYYATVKVECPSPQKTATALIRGNVHHDVLFVPKDCVTTDENGQEVVFVVQKGYAMLRRIKTGALQKEGELEILQGVFPMEEVVISPSDIRTGDRVLSR